MKGYVTPLDLQRKTYFHRIQYLWRMFNHLSFLSFYLLPEEEEEDELELLEEELEDEDEGLT